MEINLIRELNAAPVGHNKLEWLARWAEGEGGKMEPPRGKASVRSKMGLFKITKPVINNDCKKEG